MKNLRRLLAVTTLIMVLSFLLPVGQVDATYNEDIKVCSEATENDAMDIVSDAPPHDTIGIA